MSSEQPEDVCPECREATLTVLVEPEARPMRFNAQPKRMWRMAEISPSHKVAVAVDAYELHTATCRTINR
jgi:hypothetical protein